MKILVLSFYYPPDLCAGAFRMGPFVDALRDASSRGTEIQVLTTLPNRYSTFSSEAAEVERDGPFVITRVALPGHESGMIDQSRAFLRYALAAWRAAAVDCDIVFATSSRLMTAVLGALIARRADAALYLDIRDVFVDTIGDVARKPLAWLITPVLSLLERWAVGRAVEVNLVSRGFAPYFETKYPGKKFSYLSNGVDDAFLSPVVVRADAAGSGRPLRVLYAGNIGDGQGLHLIVPHLAARMKGIVNFRIVGDGGRRVALEHALREVGATNVELLPPVTRVKLLDLYGEADVLFLHLNDYDAFMKVLPSKIFEYAALGKPIWAGVAGYAAQFLANEVENAAVFAPCDAADAQRVFSELVIEQFERSAFRQRYSRRKISRELALAVLAVAPAR